MRYIAIHHTAVSARTTPYQLWAVNNYHKSKWNMVSSLGWYVGYNYFIDKSGITTQTRSHTEETMANKGHNCDVPERCDTISICMSGDFNIETPSEAQIASLRRIIDRLQVMYPDAEIVGHRDIQRNRTCPGRLLTMDYIKTHIMREKSKPNDHDVEKMRKIGEMAEKLSKLRLLIEKLKALLAKM